MDISDNCSSCYTFHSSGQIKEAIFLLLEETVDTLIPSASSLLSSHLTVCIYLLLLSPLLHLLFIKVPVFKNEVVPFLWGRGAHTKGIFKQTRFSEIIS